MGNRLSTRLTVGPTAGTRAHGVVRGHVKCYVTTVAVDPRIGPYWFATQVETVGIRRIYSRTIAS